MKLEIKNLNKIIHKSTAYNWVKFFEFDYHYTFHIDGYFTGNEYYIELNRAMIDNGYELKLTNSKYLKNKNSKIILELEDIKNINHFIETVEELITTVVDEEKWRTI